MCCTLVNLSLSDNLALLFYSLKIDHFLRLFLVSVSYTSSLLSTLGISFDKYLSVHYSLRYHIIVTQNKVILSIGVSWVASIIFAATTTSLAAFTGDWRYYHVLHYIQRLIISLLLLFCTAYIRHIRNSHEKQITLRKKQFRVQAEQLNILKLLRRSVVDVMRLNCTTAFLIITVTILGAIQRYGTWSHVMSKLLRWMYLFYLGSNPIIYIMVTSGLRKEYRKILLCLISCRKSRNQVNIMH